MSDPSLIPGLMRAAEICEQFEEQNFAISMDHQMTEMQNPGIRIPGGDGSWSLSLADHSHIHVCKGHAAREIAAFLRQMAQQGESA